MKNLFFLLVFIILGTYHNNVDNQLIPYTADPTVPMTVPSAIKMGASYDHLLQERKKRVEAARSRKIYPNAKSESAIKTYKEYVRINVTPKEYGCYDNLIFKESSWNPLAKNPKSSAFGLGQFIDKTWDLVPQSKTTNPYDQLDAMFHYIENRYGDGCSAWKFWLNNNWY